MDRDLKDLRRSAGKLPDTPGVYFFKRGKNILYIGKATSLRDRVKSYFSKDLFETRGPLIEKMVIEAQDIDFKETDSVLEALILEANSIKKHQPIYNTKEKDNKSFNFVIFTNEEYPRILVVRGRELEIAYDPEQIKYSFGPYPSGTELKEALKIIRKIFPFSDNCRPGAKKPCFDFQIGRCPGVCIGAVSKKDYSLTVRNLKLFFEGKKTELIKKLEREMKAFAKKEEFERATLLRKTIFSLQHIKDVSLLKKEGLYGGDRIEAYDIAHTGEKDRVGVMVVVEGGLPKKSDYRKFKIQSSLAGDTTALREVLERRLAHVEWPLPKVFVVDGGLQQLNTFKNILDNAGLAIPIVSVVKNERHRPREILGDIKSRRKYEGDIILANSESHRFAIGYHRLKRGKLK